MTETDENGDVSEAGTVSEDWQVAGLRNSVGLLTTAELSLMIGVTTKQLWSWRSENKGPDYVKLGRTVFYRRADVLDWIERCVVVMKRSSMQ
jgi:predicted DNA-binding transcriptional regulator AlpA